MLPSEIPWVLYEGSGDRGPFPLVVDGTPISYADKAHIRGTRFDEDGVSTLLVEGTDYQLSANSALPDLNDPSRVVTAASATLKVIQPVLDEGQYVLFERIAPADQSLSYTQAGGFSSSASERNLDAIVRVIQQIFTTMSRGIFTNPLDGIPADQIVLARAADRAGKFFVFDEDGNPDLGSTLGIGDMLKSENLSGLEDYADARTNLGVTATGADTTYAYRSNNLSDLASATTARANLGLGSAAIAALDTDGTLAANSTTRVPAQSAVVTYVAAQIAPKAPLASPALTGTPTTPTATAGTDTTQIASTAFVQAAITALRNGVAGAFDTLAEIATELGLKAPLASPAFTGNPTAPTPSPGDNDTSIATTAFVKAAIDVVLGGVAAAYDTLSEIITAFASFGPVTKSVIETGSSVSLTTDTPANVTSITIPSDGDYDLWGAVHFKGASTRTIGYLLCSISSSSATLNLAAERGAAFYYNGVAVFAGVSFITVPLQEFRLTGLTAGTVIYLVPQAGFGGSGTTVSAYGSLYARKRGL